MQHTARPRAARRISGKSALLTLAILALACAGVLIWALYPLYARGKQGLQHQPPPQQPASETESR